MAEPLTRKTLDQRGCAMPGCDCPGVDELTLNSRCHPRCGVTAMYSKPRGVLRLTCDHCGMHVADIAVDPGKKLEHC